MSSDVPAGMEEMKFDPRKLQPTIALALRNFAIARQKGDETFTLTLDDAETLIAAAAGFLLHVIQGRDDAILHLPPQH